MEIGGNQRARDFFRQHGVDDAVKSDDKKYHSRAAELYRAQLKREVYETKQGSASSSVPENAAFPDVSEEERLAAINKQKLDDAVAAAKAAVAAGEKAAPLRLSVPDGDEKILASKQIADKSKSLGATKVSGSAFDDFDAEEDEPAPASGSSSVAAAGAAVTRADLAALADAATASSSSSSHASAAPAAAAEKPRGRPVISSRLQYVDEDEERKAQQSAPRGSSLSIDVSQRSYDDKPATAARPASKSGAGGGGGGGSDRHDARDRFSNAKAISSSQFFGEDASTKVGCSHSDVSFVRGGCDDVFFDGLLSSDEFDDEFTSPEHPQSLSLSLSLSLSCNR